VTLCEIGGAKIISGGNSLATGPLDHASRDAILSNLLQRGFLSVPEPGAQEVREDTSVSRETYIAAFGPTVGDRVRLGDTELWIEVERDEVSQSYPRGYHLIQRRRYMATKSSLVEASLTDGAPQTYLTFQQENLFVKAWGRPRIARRRRPSISLSQARSLLIGRGSTR
jgi:hypothetical protein